MFQIVICCNANINSSNLKRNGRYLILYLQILLFVRLSIILWKYILESFINLDKQHKQTYNCNITEMLNCDFLFEMSEISYIIWFNGFFLMKLTCLHIFGKWLHFLKKNVTIYHETWKERRTIAKLNKHMLKVT